MLLYPQARQSIDTKEIQLRKRKRHKSCAKIPRKHKCDSKTTNNGSYCSERSELERQDAFELPTDSESEDDDNSISGEISLSDDNEEFNDCESDPFEYVNIYNNRRRSLCDSTGTFIDHAKQRKSSSINLLRLSSTQASSPNELLKKESLVIGSKALQAITRKSAETNSVIHTTTAQLELGAGGRIRQENKLNIIPQQISETSQRSSTYVGRGLDHVYVACENLANMEDELKLKAKDPHAPPSPTERHSMPNIFVGNRFNRSPNTAVYVPSWKDRHENQNQSEEVKQNSEETELHSSCLDLPAACLEAPDKLQAELLYNFNGSLHELAQSDIIPPPSLYKEENEKKVSAVVVSCNNLNETTKTTESIPRCISYQYIEMSTNARNEEDQPNPARQRNNRTERGRAEHRQSSHDEHLSKCKCCASSQCPSPRSSDSGMAGSCTIASPDPPNPETAYYYGGVLGFQIENEQTEDPTRFDVCGMFREKFLTPESTLQLQGSKENEVVTPLPLQVQASSRLRQGQGTPTTATPPTESNGMFRSGMYAHWWKKEKLPDAVVRGIANVTKAHKTLPISSQTSTDSHCSICSSCKCSLSLTGFTEGSQYCSLCQDCARSSRIEQSTNTQTTNTASFNCPLCSAEESQLTETGENSSTECPICSSLSSTAVEGKNMHMNVLPIL